MDRILPAGFGAASIRAASFRDAEQGVVMSMQANAEAEIARIAPMAQGRVGVAAIHLGSGVRLGFNNAMEFPMASTIKVPLALTVLDHVDKGTLELTTMF
jgi:beta-lactamase class A